MKEKLLSKYPGLFALDSTGDMYFCQHKINSNYEQTSDRKYIFRFALQATCHASWTIYNP